MKKEDYLEIPEQKTFLQIRNVEAQKLLQEKFHHSVQDRLSDRKPARASQNAVSVMDSGGLAQSHETFAQTPDQHGRKEMHPGNGDVFPV